MKRKAKLIQPITVEHLGQDIKLDGRTALTFLHTHGKSYCFCVRKLHGSGTSGLVLTKDEFKWIEK